MPEDFDELRLRIGLSTDRELPGGALVSRVSGRHRRTDEDEDETADQSIVLADVETEVERTGRHHFPVFDDLALRDPAFRDSAFDDSAFADAVFEDVVTPDEGVDELPGPIEAAPAGPPRQRRAGRNLPAAIGIGVLLGAAIVVSLLTYRPSFGYIVALAVAYGSYELVKAISTVEARPALVPIVVGGLAMQAAAWFRGPSGLVVGLLLTVAGILIWRLADGAAGYLRDVSASVFVLSYVPLLAGFAVLLTHPHDGAARVLLFIATVVCSDTGGYAAGVLFGRHPLAPMVSKGKTWEGFVGSVIACCVCGSLVMTLTFHHDWWKGALFGLAIVVTATLGDLGESMIKRDLGLKDMGRLLPGHGGVMDRLDSLLPCAVVAYLVLTAVLDH